MKNNSGEIMVGLLIGLLVGSVILAIDSSNEAQEIANSTGMATSPLEVVASQPGESALTVLGPAVAGAGVGWVIDQLGGNGDNKHSSRDNEINVSGEDNAVNITISGDSDNDTSNEGDDGSYNSKEN